MKNISPTGSEETPETSDSPVRPRSLGSTAYVATTVPSPGCGDPASAVRSSIPSGSAQYGTESGHIGTVTGQPVPHACSSPVFLLIPAVIADTIAPVSLTVWEMVTDMQPVEIKAYVAKCIATLRERGMRRTRALELVIEEMATAGKPVTIHELATKPALEQQCDQATVYRLVIKLLEQGIVRKLGLHERSAYFALLIPGEHHDYLVCTECGAIKSIDMSCPVKKLEKDIMKSSGFSQVYHELEFYGVCPKCA